MEDRSFGGRRVSLNVFAKQKKKKSKMLFLGTELIILVNLFLYFFFKAISLKTEYFWVWTVAFEISEASIALFFNIL